MIKKSLVILFFLWGIFGYSFFAQAFSVSPLKYTATLAPGDNKSWEVRIKNDSTRSGIFVPVILGLRQDQLGRTVFDNNIDIAENWFEPTVNSVVLSGGETALVIFSASVPLNTPPGAHYLGLGVRQKDGKSVSAQLVTILNLQVAGTAQENLSIENFSPVKKIFFDKKWFSEFLVRNRGNIGLDLKSNEDLFYFGQYRGKKVFSMGNALLAQSDRTANLNLSIENNFILPGFYRADIQIVYGLTHQTVNASVNFWYLPVWFIVGLFILLLLFFVIKKKKNVVA